MILLWAKMLGEKANIDKGAGFDLTEEVNLPLKTAGGPRQRGLLEGREDPTKHAAHLIFSHAIVPTTIGKCQVQKEIMRLKF